MLKVIDSKLLGEKVVITDVSKREAEREHPGLVIYKQREVDELNKIPEVNKGYTKFIHLVKKAFDGTVINVDLDCTERLARIIETSRMMDECAESKWNAIVQQCKDAEPKRKRRKK